MSEPREGEYRPTHIRDEPLPIDLDGIETRFWSEWNESDDGQKRAWRDDVAALIGEVHRLNHVSNRYFEEMVRRTPGSPAPEPRVMPRDVLREATGELLRIAARMVRLDGGCESGHKPGQWHMHEEPYHATGRALAATTRAALAAVPSESEPELGGHRVDVGLPVWSEETRRVPSESAAGLLSAARYVVAATNGSHDTMASHDHSTCLPVALELLREAVAEARP
jgi:hypothetical protein